MIIVSGTKRSGTSMWMQLLKAAGFSVIGEAFPMKWRENLASANPQGFYESTLRHGIYYRTNPNPETGRFVFPASVREHAVKVFIPGLVRTDMAYIDHVIATIRPWREYVASIRRLQTIEQTANNARNPKSSPAMYVHPALEWWSEMFALICDVSTRQYSVHVQSYGGLLADPHGVLTRVFSWLGRGDVECAVEVVDPNLRTQDGVKIGEEDMLEADVAAVCDELYACLAAGKPLSTALLGRVNAVNTQLRPAIRAAYEDVLRDRLIRRGKVPAPTGPADFDLMEGLE